MNQPTILVELRRMNTGNIKAYADVTVPTSIGEITLKGFRVVQREEDDDPWVGFPNSTYPKNGKTHTRNLLEVRQGVKRQITAAILEDFARVSVSS